LVFVAFAFVTGAIFVGVAALWSFARHEPLRRPVMAFALGVIAFVGVQSFAVFGLKANQDRNAVQAETNQH
jgi:hypothetical protein